MADARTLVKLPIEKIGDFNKRLLSSCKEVEVTTAMLHVIDGEPVVTLFSEMVVATEEDVAEATEDLEEGDKLDFKAGDLIPENDPVLVQICKVAAYDDKAAGTSHKFLESVFHRAEGQVVKVLKDTGSRFGWVQAADKSLHWVEEQFTYFAVLYLDPDDLPPENEADARMASTLRGDQDEGAP
jgi:hypothetical protein